MKRGSPISLSVGLLCVISVAGPSYAACPVELAVYQDRDKVATIDFRPPGEQVAVTNAFRMSVQDAAGKAAQFDGVVMWTEAPERPIGVLMSNCPEGDVTGAELAACTLWQGVVYAVNAAGEVGLLEPKGDAPPRLLLADLAPQMAQSKAFAKTRLSSVPWDAFELSGCQE